MRHYPPEKFEPMPSPAKPRQFGFVEWLIIMFVVIVAASATLAISLGRVW